MPNHAARRDKLRRLIRKAKADALLVTSFKNVTYLTGFTGDDSYLLVTLDSEVLISDSRFTTQLEEECPGLVVEIRGPGREMLATVLDVVGGAKVERLGVEADAMSLGLHNRLQEQGEGLRLVPTNGLVEELRTIKDKEEIAATRVACDQARRAFDVVRAGLTGGMTELDVAAELEYQARRFGAKGLSFPPIVAVGPRGALPHANPTSKQIGEDYFTLIDWGANEGLYVSDLTRMVVTGKVSAKFKKIYGIVLKAQLAGIAAIGPGVKCQDVDRAARRVIEKAGYGKQFGHGLGHGTGLEVHEGPRLAMNREDELKPGMIITVEPGIYLPGWGGVRIEDDILVTRTGHEVLTDVPKELAECCLA
ncbi:putative peptidase [Posidoniimonas polymericola]|uniref:Putative peptidase n=1 Tax=Posidoniimonas polymericola TaxID=2528002 RepID=A0A5C5XZ91_9BACT|nr:Xaa-Pro peptidase family protein [Posidoniimonas polymericola]TWT66802.1 putative peptidase [Posidoniimonas polymericola]